MAVKLKSIINLMNRKRKKERKCKTRGKKGDLVFSKITFTKHGTMFF